MRHHLSLLPQQQEFFLTERSLLPRGTVRLKAEDMGTRVWSASFPVNVSQCESLEFGDLYFLNSSLAAQQSKYA